MFLAHFSGTPLTELMDWDLEDVTWWYNEAAKLHNKLNASE